jgi:hypothetical protein
LRDFLAHIFVGKEVYGRTDGISTIHTVQQDSSSQVYHAYLPFIKGTVWQDSTGHGYIIHQYVETILKFYLFDFHMELVQRSNPLQK